MFINNYKLISMVDDENNDHGVNDGVVEVGTDDTVQGDSSSDNTNKITETGYNYK